MNPPAISLMLARRQVDFYWITIRKTGMLVTLLVVTRTVSV